MSEHDHSSLLGTTRAGDSTSSLSFRLARTASRFLPILCFTLITSSAAAQPDPIDLTASAFQLDEDDGLASILVTRGGGGATVTVDYATSPGTAVPGVDYFDAHGTLTFDADHLSQVFQIRVFDDHSSSATKTVTIQLSNATGGATIGLGTAILSIVDNDSPGDPILQVDQVVDFGPVEVGQTGTRPVGLMNKGQSPLTISAPVVASGGDLGFSIASTPPPTLLPGQGATFAVAFSPTAPGASAGVLEVHSNGGNEVVLLRGRGVETTAPTVAITNPTGGEVFHSGSPVSVTFTASDNDEVDIIYVEYSVNGGGAFQPIASVHESQPVVWNIPANLVSTTQGVIRVTASDRSGNTGSAQSGLFAIMPPPQPTFFIDDVVVVEGTGSGLLAVFTVTRSPMPGPFATVQYATQPGSAIQNDDYVPTSGVLSFPSTIATQSIAVQIAPDSFDEPTETFIVRLSNPTNATITKTQGIGTIQNDDGLPVIGSVTPRAGTVGTSVVIHGSNLRGVTAVKFGAVSTPPVHPPSDTSIKVIVPSSTETGRISVTTGTGTTGSTTVFKIPPKIDSFAPTSGSPGTPVTITGLNLKLPAEVRVGNRRAFQVAERGAGTALWFRAPPLPGPATNPLWVYDVANGVAEGPVEFTIQPVPPGSTTPLWSYTAPAPVQLVRGDISAGTGLTLVGSGSVLTALWSKTVGPNVGGTVAWSHDFAPGTIQDFPSPVPLSAPSGGGVFLFVAASNGVLHKVNAQNGSVTATSPSLLRPTCPSDKISGTPAVQLYDYSDQTFRASVGEDLVFVATHYECGTTSQNRVYGLSANDLSVKWTYNDDGSKNVDYFSEGCAIDYATNQIFCGANLPAGATGQNSLFAIDTKSGSLLWSTNAGSIHNRPIIRSTSRPSVVIVADHAGLLHGFVTAEDREETYVPAPLVATLGSKVARNLGHDDFHFTHHDKLLVTDTAGSIRSLSDLWSTAQLDWTLGGGGRYVSEPIVSPSTGRVYIGRSDGKISEIDAAYGQEPAVAIGNDTPDVYDPSLDMDADTDNDGNPDQLHFIVAAAGTTVRRFSVPWGDYSLVTAADESPAVPGGLVLSQNAPNPFNPLTRVEFELREGQRVRFDVFDLQGRRVATLVNDMRPAGRHSVAWNGLEDSGEPAASGIYFGRLSAGDAQRSVKMVIAR